MAEVNEFAVYLVGFIDWVLVHIEKLITSISILPLGLHCLEHVAERFAFYCVFRFRHRIALATGLEHITLIRFSWRDICGFNTRQRPVEVFIWKARRDLKPLKSFNKKKACEQPFRWRNEAQCGCFGLQIARWAAFRAPVRS